MPQCLVRFFYSLLIVALVGLSTTASTRAESEYQPLAVASSYDLINAVNALRISYGLAPYSINPILMYTAQAQADFMASSKDVTHFGPGGIGLTARLLAAGYPLAGDLPAGGFRAENVTSGNEDRTAESVVEGWSGDALHLNTMISPNLSEIGAGVALADGRVYFVIDCALPTTGGLSEGATSIRETGSAAPTLDMSMPVVILSTPNADGNVIHEVKQGESLWQLAIAYEVKVDDIKRLNNLLDNNIYPGNKLLIKQVAFLPTALIAALPSNGPSMTSTTESLDHTATSTPITFTSTEIASWSSQASMPVDKNSILYITIGIIVLALLAGAAFTGLGSRKKPGN